MKYRRLHEVVTFLGALACVLGSSLATEGESSVVPISGRWVGHLTASDRRINFGIELKETPDGGWGATIINGSETLAVPVVRLEGDQFTMAFDYYDSKITATVGGEGRVLTGKWERRRGPEEWVRMNFEATPMPDCAGVWAAQETRAIARTRDTLRGVRAWRADFADDPEPGVMLLRLKPEPIPVEEGTGTFLTTTGDYRFLGAEIRDGELTLSCFDGVHAFLFKAAVDDNGVVKGDFYSGPTYHTTWTATPDPNAALPDGFGLAKLNPVVELNSLGFPDLDGVKKSLADPAFAGKARIIELFGTWCPNCRDETVLLRELNEKYKGRGLSILGLAFEVTGDAQRDAKQVRIYEQRLGVTWPVLLAGTNDKKLSAAAFPVLEKIPAYPTTLFVDRAGKVRAVYTGFSGPATGEEYTKLRSRFEKLIETMLSE